MNDREELHKDPEVSKILDEDVRAAFKIEITFGPARSSLGEYPALLSMWESGKFFHGGGDSSLYWCLDGRNLHPRSATKLVMALLDGKEKQDVYGCGYPIPNAAMGGGIALCSHCQKQINSDYLTGQLPFFGSTQDLATFCSRYFPVFGDRGADIYCKYHPTDIRYKSMEQARGLETARRLRGMFIYPYKNILRDTVAGASLEGRFRAFFNS